VSPFLFEGFDASLFSSTSTLLCIHPSQWPVYRISHSPKHISTTSSRSSTHAGTYLLVSSALRPTLSSSHSSHRKSRRPHRGRRDRSTPRWVAQKECIAHASGAALVAKNWAGCQWCCAAHTDPHLYALPIFPSLSTHSNNPHLTTIIHLLPSPPAPSSSWSYPSRPWSWLPSTPSFKLASTSPTTFLVLTKRLSSARTRRRPASKNFQRVQSLLCTHTTTPQPPVLPVNTRLPPPSTTISDAVVKCCEL
jgi:hypothetical protein